MRVYCSGREDSGGGLIGVQYGMSDFLYREYRFQPDTGASPVSYDRGRWLGEPGRELTPVVRPRRAVPGRAVAGAAGRRSELGAVARNVRPAARGRSGRRVPPFRAPTRGRGHRDLQRQGRGRPRRLARSGFALPAASGTRRCRSATAASAQWCSVYRGVSGSSSARRRFWAGRPAETDRSAAYEAFAATREHLFAERYAEAHRVYAESFLAPNENPQLPDPWNPAPRGGDGPLGDRLPARAGPRHRHRPGAVPYRRDHLHPEGLRQRGRRPHRGAAGVRPRGSDQRTGVDGADRPDHRLSGGGYGDAGGRRLPGAARPCRARSRADRRLGQAPRSLPGGREPRRSLRSPGRCRLSQPAMPPRPGSRQRTAASVSRGPVR